MINQSDVLSQSQAQSVTATIAPELPPQPSLPKLNPKTSLKDFWVKPAEYDMVRRLVEFNQPILLVGPNGSGKSTLVEVIADDFDAVLCRIGFHRETDEFALLSREKIETNDNGHLASVTADMVLTSSLRLAADNPAKLVIFNAEEFNFSEPSKVGYLNTLLSGSINDCIILSDSEKIYRPPNWRFIATMNPGYTGTRGTNEALTRSRCIQVVLKRMSGEIETKIVLSKFPHLRACHAEAIINCANAVRKSKDQGNTHDFDLDLRTIDQIVLVHYCYLEAKFPDNADTVVEAFMQVVGPKMSNIPSAETDKLLKETKIACVGHASKTDFTTPEELAAKAAAEAKRIADAEAAAVSAGIQALEAAAAAEAKRIADAKAMVSGPMTSTVTSTI